jgi:hypothetical protein
MSLSFPSVIVPLQPIGQLAQYRHGRLELADRDAPRQLIGPRDLPSGRGLVRFCAAVGESHQMGPHVTRVVGPLEQPVLHEFVRDSLN